MYYIEPPKAPHTVAIEDLLDAAFGPNRHTKKSYAFRDGVDDVTGLRFVALDTQSGDVVGTIRFWPVVIGETAAPAVLLGPLGVHAGRQGAGIGAALIEHGLHEAREQGHAICVLVGPLNYYGRFGFAPALPHDITMPGEDPHRLLIRELQNDALEGISGDIMRAPRNIQE